MRDYVYDNSFQGYLTAIFLAYEAKDYESEIHREKFYEGHLLNEVIIVHTDTILSNRVAKGVLEKLGEEWFELLHKVYLSEDQSGDTIAFKAIRLAFIEGKQVLKAESHKIIQPFLKLGRRVSRECHDFLGYVRFIELKTGTFFSEIQPTYNILPLLAPHFSDRLKDQSWVLYDSKRHQAAFYDKENWYINTLMIETALEISSKETCIQNMWRGYFEELAIEERINLKLQQQKIPKKYWRFFIEDIGSLGQNGIMNGKG